MKRIILLSLALLVGCAASRMSQTGYNPATGATTYRSTKVVGNIDASAGLVSGQRVSMQAIASCTGQDCRAPQVELSFLNDTSRDMSLDYRRVQIRFDAKKLEWEDPARQYEPAHYMLPRGEFIRVPIPWSDFKQMANAEDVQVIFGLTGTRSLSIPHVRLAPLRQLLDEVNSAAASES